MKKFLTALVIGLSLIASSAYAQTVFTGKQGGTGIGTAVVGDVGKVLTVSSVAPLVWTLTSPGAGSQTPWSSNIYAALYSLQSAGSISATSSLITQATSTNLAITGITSSLLKTNANGSVIPAVAGTDYLVSTFSYPFPNNATTSILSFTNGFLSGSSTFLGATTTFMGNIFIDSHDAQFVVHTIRAHASDGLFINSVSGSPIALLGAGGGQNATFYDGTTITGLLTANGGIKMGALSGGLGANGGNFYVGATTTFSTGLTYSNGNVVCDTASASVFGCLTAANFSVFNNKISSSSLSATSPIFYNSSTGVISSQAVSASQDGYLTSAYFTVFNNKISSSSLSGTNGVTYNSTTGVIDCTASSRSATGCLSSAYFTVFDNKVSSSSLFAYPFPNNATTSSLTLGGLTLTSFSGGLGANPNTGLVYGAPTTTFTGTSPISLTYLNGQVTGACTTASAGVAGCLNSTDWSTFNGKENVLTFNAPLVRSSNTISIFQWPFSSATTYTGVSTSTLINFSGGIMSTASSTLQLLKATDLTVTNTITGSVSGSAGSVTNALTFSNGGAGDASGTTYNGSAARTISYNSIGAQPSGNYATFQYPFTQATTFTGMSTTSLLSISGGVMSTASSTFQILRAGTFTMPSESNGCANFTSGALTSTGVACGSGSGGFSFTSATTYNGVSTSTLLNLAGGVMSTASSTLQLFKAGTINISSNGTNAWLISNSGTANQLDFSTSTIANATTSFAALSLLSTGGIQVNNGQGTSTLVSGYGLDLTNGGCFAIRGTCMTGGAASAIGGTGAVQFASGAAFQGDVSNFFWDDTNNLLGLATGTPGTLLSLGATGAGININANATSTFNKGINLNGGCFAINGTCVGGGTSSGLTGTLGQMAYFSGTNSAIGTSSAFIDPYGFFGIGTTTLSTFQAKLTVESGSLLTNTLLTGLVNNYMQLKVKNYSNGNLASSDLVAEADNGSETTHYVNLGINGSAGANTPFTTANHAYLYAIDDILNIGSLGSSGQIRFHTTGGLSPVFRMIIDEKGRIGVGTTTPLHKLQVEGRLKDSPRFDCRIPYTGQANVVVDQLGSATVGAGGCEGNMFIDIQVTTANSVAVISYATNERLFTASGTPVLGTLSPAILTSTAANNGITMKSPLVGSATSTNGQGIAIEAYMRFPDAATGSSTSYFMGFNDEAVTSVATEAAHTKAANECIVTASTTPNLKLVCRKANVETMVDTGIATSTMTNASRKILLIVDQTGANVYVDSGSVPVATIAIANVPVVHLRALFGVHLLAGIVNGGGDLGIGNITVWGE